MTDRRLAPRTAIDRGPDAEEPIELDPGYYPQSLDSAGGDTSGDDIDSNVGGAFASAGLDSGGAVGVRRGMAVGRPGFEYDDTERGETGSDVPDEQGATLEDVLELPLWAQGRRT